MINVRKRDKEDINKQKVLSLRRSLSIHFIKSKDLFSENFIHNATSDSAWILMDDGILFQMFVDMVNFYRKNMFANIA